MAIHAPDPQAALATLDHLAALGIPPDGRAALELAVGLDDYLARLRQETMPHLASGGAEIRFVEAPYGRGKSHLLRAIEAACLDVGLVTAYVDCTSTSKPFASFKTTYDSIVTRMRHRDVPRRGAAEMIAHAARHHAEQARYRGLATNPYLLPEFRNVAAALCRTALAEPGSATPRLPLEALLHDSATDRVRVPGLYREFPWLPRPLGKIRPKNASLWLRSLCNLPYALGYPGLVVLFDETEQVLSIAGERAPARMTHFANLRNIVDHVACGTLNGCLIVYAVVEDFLERARQDLDALAQRVERVRLDQDGGRIANPRAVWTDLDELTIPDPTTEAFYHGIVEKLLALGHEAGMSAEVAERIRREAPADFQHNSIHQGAVRLFVKRTATRIVENTF